jgi:phasin
MAETVVPFEMPEHVRALAEKGVAQARDNYAKFKDAAEAGNGAIEAVISATTKGMSEYSTKMLQIVQTNAHANFDFAQSLAGVKSPTEFMELWTSHARQQVETMTTQGRELAELVQKIASEASEPVKASTAKMFKMPAA